MFSPGNILYFSNFVFPNGNPCKPKYFIVISMTDEEFVVASLPTSHDHIPDGLPKVHGCINNSEMCVNCYYFEKGKAVSECGEFAFPLDTYVYGEQVMMVDKKLLEGTYKEGLDYKKLCKLKDSEYRSLTHCLRLSSSMKRKIKQSLPR